MPNILPKPKEPLHPGHSKWVIAISNQVCTNTTCIGTKQINIGDLCVKHLNTMGGYGCAACAKKFWASEDAMVNDLANPPLGDEACKDFYVQGWGAHWVITEGDHVCQMGGGSTQCGSSTIPMHTIALKAYTDFYCEKCVMAYSPGTEVPQALRERLAVALSKLRQELVKHPLTLTSFGYVHGMPKVDPVTGVVIDVRKTIRNPWKNPALRKLTGKDKPVIDFISRCPSTAKVLSSNIHLPMVGKREIFIGCFGGKHRSVAIAEMLGEYYRANAYTVEVIHRDLKTVEVKDGNS